MDERETEATSTEERQRDDDRVLDTEALKGFAHPLRVQLFETLAAYGPATASGLAERLGESSGATSYHLRQLARHGLVREVPDRGSARERWWERTPGSITVSVVDFPPHSAGWSASRLVAAELDRNRAELLRAFTTTGADVLDPAWVRASGTTTSNLRLTLEEMIELEAELGRAYNDVVQRYVGRGAPGSRPVQVHLNLFPLVDGVPSEEPS